MNKLEVFAISFLLALTLALGAGAVYQGTHSKNVRDAAVLKAQQAQYAAKRDAAAYKLNVQAAEKQLQAVTAQKVAACSALAAHKLTDPACK